MNKDCFDYTINKIGDTIFNLEVNANLAEMIDRFFIGNQARILKQEWKSKYNTYIVYDYAPFATEGFKYSVDIKCRNKDYTKWLMYEIEQTLNRYIMLEKLYAGVA